MRFVVVTGMSGAGKSTALKMLEDVGYFCIDNLPTALIPKLTELLKSQAAEFNKVALGVDIRGCSSPEKMIEMLENMEHEVLFLEAGDDVLIKRYKETRRSHPLALTGSIKEGLIKERKLLSSVKQTSDYIIDTSQLLPRELKVELRKIFVDNKEYKNLYITVMSFGFKYGIPSDADLVFDVRFLPNPYYIEKLRPKTGNDDEVRNYVMKNENAHIFLNHLKDMLDFLIPNYISEGKSQLVIAIGCTGGKHRSVTFANELYEYFLKEEQYGIKIEHRDIEKDAKRKAE